VLTLKIN